MKEKEYRMTTAVRDALLFLQGIPDVALGDRVLVKRRMGKRSETHQPPLCVIITGVYCLQL